MSLSDVELMQKIKSGSKSAFTKIVNRYQSKIINFFYKNLWDKSLSEDLAQEVFVRLYKSAKNYYPKAKFTTFIYRIARNILIDYFRSKDAKNTAVSLQNIPNADDDGKNQLIDTIPSKSPNPDSSMINAELSDALKNAINKLPEDQKIVFILGEFEKLQYQEISEILKIPLGTVKSRMHASYNRLRKLLAEYAPYDSDSTNNKDKK